MGKIIGETTNNDFRLQHPLALLTYSKRKFWLLLIPILRRLIVYNFNVIEWISWGLWDLLLLGLLAGIILFQYFSFRYKFNDFELIIQNNFFIKSVFKINFNKVSLLSSKETFWSRPFRAVKLQIESEAKSAFNKRKASDVVIVTDKKTAERVLWRFRSGSSAVKRRHTVSYKNPRSMLVIYSILFSSAYSGGIYLLILLYQSADIIAETLGIYYGEILSRFKELSENIITGISDGLIFIIVITACGYIYSFISNILRLQNYRLTIRGRLLEIKGGYFSRWSYYINRDYVNYTDIRQNMIMKIFGLYSINIGCTGYGRKRGEIPVFIPITELPKGGAVLEMFLPGLGSELAKRKPEKRTAKTSFFKLTWLPLFLIIGFALGFSLLVYIIPNFARLYLFLLIMSEIPSALFMTACVTEYFSGGVTIDKEHRHFAVYCRKGLSQHLVIVPENKVSTIRERKTYFGKRHNISNITIITCGERGVKHTARSVKSFELDIL
ncbi:MAG: PH domain-containing protein [Ruminococcus sp.]|jgi:uncharacterized membrane protein YdbT with pleckstrin-like domain|nr:PH domain-containing protein [Ruminococcus sp.]